MSAMTTLVAALCLSFLLADHHGGAGPASWAPSWQVQAQQAARRQSSRGPSLHNKAHASTVRNILQPKFQPEATLPTPGNHTSNVAVIVSSSRYWFNYRHVTNVLAIYRLLKRGGMDDDNIILMLADDIPCNMRNPFRGKIYPRGVDGEDLMADAEIDYSGTDVTVDAFARVLLGRPLPGEDGTGGGRSWPTLDGGTNVLVYLTGHGGDNFFKFQDGEELMSNDVASIFSQMYELKRYNEILFIADTCQAFTMADEIQVPNVFSVGSSLKDQNSYASHSDPDVGQSVIDRYSKIVKDFVDDAVTLTSTSASSKDEAFDKSTVAVMERLNLYDALVRIPMNHGNLGPNSQVGHADHLCSRRMNQVPLSDFFAASSTERESQRDRERLTAALWMNDVPIVAESDHSRRIVEVDAEKECAVGTEPKPNESGAVKNTQEKPKPQSHQRGMSTSDPKFIVLSVGFLLCLRLSAAMW